jgi:sialate O-acetylesterase
MHPFDRLVHSPHRLATTVQILLLVLGCQRVALADATLELGAPFADGAVLQREMPVPVWGWSKPGTVVAVEFAGQKQTATAGADGRWTATLEPLQASAEPRELTIREASGASCTLTNVLVGEVWLASGQSNMQWLASKSDADILVKRIVAEAQAAGKPLPPIREWAVDDVFAALHPVEHARGTWKVDDFGNSSAVAFAFAQALHAELGVPIGILNCSFSQTSIEAWTPRGGFAAGTDAHSRELQRRMLETDPTSPEHKAAWEKFYTSISEALAADAERLKRGEPARGIPSETPGNLRGNRDASWLFNARIAPAVPYAIRGCIWNQGYANINGGLTYYDNLHALVRGWRDVWGRPDLPVYFHQFYCPKPQEGPSIEPMAEMRLGTWLARDIPHTGMASQVDVEGAIHYRHKTVPGRRLARHALAKQYDRDVVTDGPMFKGYRIEGDKVVVEFDHADGGLVVGETGSNALGKQEGATGFSDPTLIENGADQVKLFYLADERRAWHPARVTIEGEKVILSAPGVTSPRGVSYATGGVGFRPNLYNRALLPMTPFIVHDQKLVTSRDWPDETLTVAGVEPDPAAGGLLNEYRKMPILAAPFRAHAVLQADRPLTIWGECVHDWGYEAKGKAEIRFQFTGPDVATVEQVIPVTAGMREWRVTLPPLPASVKPKTLRVSFTIDGELAHERACEGIVIGDVWYVAATGQQKEAETSTGPVRIFARKALRTTHRMPSRYSISVSTTPENRFESLWKDVSDGPAAAFGNQLHELTGRPIGIVWMAGPDLELAQWIGFDQLADVPSLRADYENLAAARPGNPFYEANAQRHIAAWKDYWGDYVPRLIAAKRPPDAAAWGSFPTLDAGLTSEAAGGYNVMVAPFADFAFKGMVFLGGPKTVAADAGAGYAEQLPALAASWRATFGGTPAFFYAVPVAGLAAKATPPTGIAPPATAIPVESWDDAVAIGRVLETITAAGNR